MGNYLTSSNSPQVTKPNQSFVSNTPQTRPPQQNSFFQSFISKPIIRIDPKLSVPFGFKEVSSKLFVEKVGSLQFFIQLFGTDKNIFKLDFEESSIQIRIGGKEEIIPKLIFEKEKGLIIVSFFARKTGTYLIQIKINNVDIERSPFQLILEPSELDLTLTKVTPNIEDFLYVGGNYSFQIQFYDLYCNPTDLNIYKDGLNLILSRDQIIFKHQALVEQGKDGLFTLKFQPLEEDIQNIHLVYFDISLFKQDKIPVLSKERFSIFQRSVQDQVSEFKLDAFNSDMEPYEAFLVLNQGFFNLYYYMMYFFKMNLYWVTTRDYKMTYNFINKKLEIFLKKENKIIYLKGDKNEILIYSIYKVFSRRQRSEGLMFKIRDMFNNKQFDKTSSLKLYQKSLKMKKTLDLISTLWKAHVQDCIKLTIELNQKIADNLMKDYDKLTLICKDCFMENTTLFNIILQEFSQVFIMKDKDGKDVLIQFMSMIDELLKTDQITDEDMDRYLSFVSLCKDKDIFIEYYRLSFTKRLITLGDEDSTRVYNERKMISKIKSKFGISFVGKLEGLMKEKIYSKEMTNDFIKNCKLDIKMDLLVFSNLFFPNISNEKMIVPNEISHCPVQFEKYYKTNYKRNLTWVYSLGNIQLLGRWKSGEYMIQLDTIQGFILLLFNSMKQITIPEMQKVLNISEKRLKVTLKKLELKKIIQVDNDKVSLNEEFQSRFNKIIMKEEVISTVQEDTSIQKTVNINRNIEIDACIVRIMKSKNIYSHQELMIETAKQLLPYFQPKPVDIRKRIDDLINREFIARSEDQKDVYVYLA